MLNNYKEGICKGCSENKLIVYKSGSLCFVCNNRRLSKRYSERQKKKPLISHKAKKTIEADNKVYETLWANKPHVCEECSTPLKGFSKGYFSHILTKGAHPNFRHDLRNFQILCIPCHQTYEFGDRKAMRTYTQTKEISFKLLQEYHDVRQEF